MDFQPILPAKRLEPHTAPTSCPAVGHTDQQPATVSQPVIDPIHQTLKDLFRQASTLPKNSPRRRKLIDRLVVTMQQSDKLWTQKDHPDHEDAASETWLYLIRKLNGDETLAYDPNKGSPITLWNQVYKRKLAELSQATKNKQTQWEASQRVYPRQDAETGQWQDSIETLAEPEPMPDSLDEVRSLIESDPTRKLSRTHIRQDRLGVTVQALALEIVRRLQRGETWTLKQLADHFDVPDGTMNSFWSQKCKPLLRELGQNTRQS